MNICNVCLSNQDDFLGFPCLSLPTTLPSIIANKLQNNEVPPSSYVKTYNINICSHHIHYNCYKQLLQQSTRKMSVDEIMSLKTQVYNCPIDRGIRNFFLPFFNSFSSSENKFKMTITKKMKEIIDDFIIHAFHQLSTSYIIVPIQSFAGIILTLEVRLRNRPDTLDSPSVQILLTNLLLTLYHGIHEHAIKEDISKTIKDPLTNLVYLILKSDDPINDFTSYVQIAATHLEGLDL